MEEQKKRKRKPRAKTAAKPRKPTKQQMIFADKYIQLGNIEEAAREAGYSITYARASAYKLLENIGIANYIKQRMDEIQKPTIASAEEVLEHLTGVMRGEIKDQFGLDASLADRNRAAELLGKRYALYTDKKEVTGAVPVVLVDDVTE